MKRFVFSTLIALAAAGAQAADYKIDGYHTNARY